MFGQSLAKSRKLKLKLKGKKDNHFIRPWRIMTHHWCYWTEDREPIYEWSDSWEPESISREDVAQSICQYLKYIEHAW